MNTTEKLAPAGDVSYWADEFASRVNKIKIERHTVGSVLEGGKRSCIGVLVVGLEEDGLTEFSRKSEECRLRLGGLRVDSVVQNGRHVVWPALYRQSG